MRSIEYAARERSGVRALAKSPVLICNRFGRRNNGLPFQEDLLKPETLSQARDKGFILFPRVSATEKLDRAIARDVAQLIGSVGCRRPDDFGNVSWFLMARGVKILHGARHGVDQGLVFLEIRVSREHKTPAAEIRLHTSGLDDLYPHTERPHFVVKCFRQAFNRPF